ncbi:unnamed protein product [Nezara viridula]|uniref:Uncharacterized protein n=1 Tax=Nezara viridula TaxID=85310 RepID=A0A9P0H915_NEZVI|nr:unnamed protein product [Nezara viridula]
MLKLQIPLDGVEESIVYDELISSSVKDLPKTPNEFRLEPTEVKIQAKHRAEVKVFLVANIAKKYSGNIIISSEMHLYENKKLPVCFNAIAPEITCSPDTLRLPYCFKGSEYEQTILISNKGNVQVSFWLLDYKDLQRGIYCHRRDNEMGLIDPLGSAEFTFQLSSGSLGEHNFTLLGFVLGNGIVPLCDITIVGIGPVVIVKNESLIWSNINILKPYEKTLSIFNASPIIAEFIISFEKDSNLWMVSIHDGIIDPDETVYVTITPNPIDVGLLKDHLKIQVKDSRILTVKLEAMVTGSSIVFSPNIFPFIDFGPALRYLIRNS